MKIGIILGTGMSELQKELKNKDVIVIDRFQGKTAHAVNYHKLIKDLSKKVDCIISVTACGSLCKELKPGLILQPRQLIDWTHQLWTYSNTGQKHTPFAHPFNPELQNKIKHITPITGTLITIRGPHFSTLAEGQMYTALSANLINMTTAPEAKLAAELGTPYTAICTITDYDSYVETKPTNINIIKKQIIIWNGAIQL